MGGAIDEVAGVDEPSAPTLPGALDAQERMRAYGLPRIGLTPREVGDVLTLGIGALAPLLALPGATAWRRICTEGRLPDAQCCATPLSVSADRITADTVQLGEWLGLYDPQRDEIIAALEVAEMFEADPDLEARSLYADAASDHPGRRALRDQGEVLLAGALRLMSLGGLDERYGAAFRTPAQTRACLHAQGWRRVLAVDALQADARERVDAALEMADGVLLMARAGRLSLHGQDDSGELGALTLAAAAPRPGVLPCIVPMAMRGAAGRDQDTLAQMASNYGASAVF